MFFNMAMEWLYSTWTDDKSLDNVRTAQSLSSSTISLFLLNWPQISNQTDLKYWTSWFIKQKERNVNWRILKMTPWYTCGGHHCFGCCSWPLDRQKSRHLIGSSCILLYHCDVIFMGFKCSRAWVTCEKCYRNHVSYSLHYIWQQMTSLSWSTKDQTIRVIKHIGRDGRPGVFLFL